MKLKCWIDSDGGFWARDVVFPFAPFPGMIVGPALVVAEVMVCQGDLDGDGETCVRLTCGRDVDLVAQGWRWEVQELGA